MLIPHVETPLSVWTCMFTGNLQFHLWIHFYKPWSHNWRAASLSLFSCAFLNLKRKKLSSQSRETWKETSSITVVNKQALQHKQAIPNVFTAWDLNAAPLRLGFHVCNGTVKSKILSFHRFFNEIKGHLRITWSIKCFHSVSLVFNKTKMQV